MLRQTWLKKGTDVQVETTNITVVKDQSCKIIRLLGNRTKKFDFVHQTVSRQEAKDVQDWQHKTTFPLSLSPLHPSLPSCATPLLLSSTTYPLTVGDTTLPPPLHYPLPLSLPILPFLHVPPLPSSPSPYSLTVAWK